MVEWRTAYYGPMDREYHEASSEVTEHKQLEEPIFPLNRLGETVPESAGGRNIVQTTQAAIRGGAGTIQLIISPPPDTIGPGSIGARVGKEVRQALREIALANEVKIAGTELPTSLNNLSGFDHRQNTFSDEVRKRNLSEVKDAIKFQADVMGGGEIDLVSWEFPRGINDSDWNRGEFKRESEVEKLAWLVDSRTGRTARLPKDQSIHIAYDKNTFERLPAEEGGQLQEFSWKDFERWAEHNKKTGKGPKTPEEIFVEVQLGSQIDALKGQRARSLQLAEQEKRNIETIKRELERAREQADAQAIEKLSREIDRHTKIYEDYINGARSASQQAEDLKETIKSYKPIKDYGLKRSVQTYAEAGIAAMQETELGKAKGVVTQDLAIGPELGWPDYFGGHPDEFIKIVKESRKEMAKMLTDKNSPYYNPRLSRKEAEKRAERHIKGLFDTSHLGMWLAHFKPLPGESESARIERFNKWFVKKTEELAKSGTVGSIQFVDSGSAAHGHLPPGEGIFPVIKAAEIFKKEGFDGFLVSEGHEEERFGQGRIRSKLWQRAGNPLGKHNYFHGAPSMWPREQSSYFGKQYSPLFMFGSYSPSNEFKLWSDVPLE
ncbi:hypothetical protein D6825_01705 [Candidatus Woesearchaeota archaeon]|nr:MAG: hypothetical protein D6825_01705 [Candidatus Woesearchaeota archaeon]